MAGSTEMLAAFRELTTAKQLERSDLLDLLRDGIVTDVTADAAGATSLDAKKEDQTPAPAPAPHRERDTSKQ